MRKRRPDSRAVVLLAPVFGEADLVVRVIDGESIVLE